LVVTADLDAPGLTHKQQQVVRELLNNAADSHKTVIGATFSQTQNFLRCISEELSS
jgi:hypothetical protein